MQEGSFRCDANVSVRREGDAEARHALRDQESQQLPLHAAGDRIRGAAPDRAHRRRRHGRPGDAPLRSRARRDAPDAQQGRRAGLPLLPRSGPAAARDRRRVDRARALRNARIAGGDEGAFRVRVRAPGAGRRRPHRRSRDGPVFRDRGEVPGGAHRAHRQAGRELGAGRIVRRAQPRRARHRRGAGPRGSVGGVAAAHWRRHDLRQDRQGRLRRHVGGRARRRRGCDHRRQRTGADFGRRRDREDRRRRAGCERRDRRRIPRRQGEGAPVARRQGDGRNERQGRSRAGQCDAAAESSRADGSAPTASAPCTGCGAGARPPRPGASSCPPRIPGSCPRRRTTATRPRPRECAWRCDRGTSDRAR